VPVRRTDPHAQYRYKFTSGVVAGARRQSPSNLGLSENNCRKVFFLWEHFRPKVQEFGLKTAIWGKFKGKIETLSIHNYLCRKIATSCSAYILSHDAPLKLRREILCCRRSVALLYALLYGTLYNKCTPSIYTRLIRILTTCHFSVLITV